MVQKVNLQAGVTAVTLTPLARFVRSFIQILISVGIAIPILLNTPAVAGNAVLAKDLGVIGGLIMAIVAVWNSLENYAIIPVAGGQPAQAITPSITAASVHSTIPPREVPHLY